MLVGLSFGLVVAAAVYVTDRRQPTMTTPAQSDTATPTRGATVVPTQAPIAGEEPHPATRFDFYEILPKFEVVLPAVESEANPDSESVSIDAPGNYVLQAGSFTKPADAERMRANLALLGIESQLQRVSIDDDVYHRVRVGPTSKLNELNAVRRRLWDAEIEVLLIKVPN